VLILVQDLHIRILNAATGELIRELTLDPTRNYQPTGAPKGPKRNGGRCRIRTCVGVSRRIYSPSQAFATGLSELAFELVRDSVQRSSPLWNKASRRQVAA
jgi:hypothetical protein